MEISEIVVEYLFATWPVGRLATLNSDGSPHQIPIVFTWHDGCFWSPIDGKPKRSVQPARVDNVIANPTASLLIDNYDADWTRLWWIRAELEVNVIRLHEAESETQEQARRLKGNLKKSTHSMRVRQFSVNQRLSCPCVPKPY